ncbi:SusC/RagA family TonB-linked outer membrane protein [Niastella populi]|uniref:SusC/RagA family protein n=1 Tax=Niastella populi TaxID=550983 RepID=A0A1V9F625_9BACT|nr:SusC/RagA family TonB-linked outer membrane protein [Niastella populi]OQP53656.1 SusC/RagA family protein [Niastella populi]
MRKKGSERFFRGCLLTVAMLLVCAAFAQNGVTFNRNKAPRKSLHAGVSTPARDTTVARQPLFVILKQLNQSKGIFFLFSEKSFGDVLVKPVSNNNRPVEQILQELLQSTGLKYKRVNNKTFVIVDASRDNSPLNKSSSSSSASETGNTSAESKMQLVKGRVTTVDGKPLLNVSIWVKGTNRGTTTNANGEFEMEGSKGEVLEMTSVGYDRKEVVLNNSSAIIYLHARLSVVDKMMNEVVVTALGVNKYSRSLGYSLSTVTAEDLTSAGNTNFASALYGRSPGVLINTAPGGATSAVQVQIRGVNSLNFNAQPLYVVDGIVIRNTNEKGIAGINNGGYWVDPRIRGNGILDINTADIDNLTILKGASATALYGSEAAAGVVVITTKKGAPKKRLGVSVNYTNTIEQAAFLPDFQHTYGPGADRATNLSEGATEEGWIPVDLDGDGANDHLRPNFTAYAQFGPKFDGRDVAWWDGHLRPYKAHENNYKQLYRTGFNSILNTSVANQTDKFSYRLSYTRNDYKGIQHGGDLQRNTFHLNSNFKINDKLNVDVISSYFNSKVHNRPYQLTRIIAAYAGFYSRAEDMGVVLNKYKTSEGYKWVPWNQSQRNPAEALRSNVKVEMLDFLWMQLRNSEDEFQDRFLNSVTLNYELNSNLKFRARIGNDLTSLKTETRQYNEYPVIYNPSNASTGKFKLANGRYSIFYGDGLLTWTKKWNSKWSLSVTGGFQARKENYNDQSSETTDGLLEENWFSLENSYHPVLTQTDRSAILKYAYLGFFNLAYKNYLFLEGTARKEYSSTLPPGKNSYFYPSLNTGFIFSEVMNLPGWISFGKVRSSYGIVGNAPPAYTSPVAYTQTTLFSMNGPVAALNAQINAGNNDIRPENKYELEVGLESMLFKNRLGFEVTWFNSRTVNQIVQLSIPSSSGAMTKLVNAGELKSNGVEMGLHAFPLTGKKLKWKSQLNVSMSRSTVSKLASGVSNIVFYEAEQNAVRIVAEEGETVGNIYVNPRLKDNEGNFVIGSNGLYVIDNNRYEKVGNVMPRVTGGWFNKLNWKMFSLDWAVDYRLGGKIVSPPLKYNLGAGMYKSTLQYRDAENGGLPYYISNGEKILLPGHQAQSPDGSKVYHDGVILPGVTVSGKENTKIVDAAYYYMNTYIWGASAVNESVVVNNSYIKLREVVLAYSLPAKFANKLHFNNIRFSLIGRNLLYFYRTLKNIDPEATIGSNWIRQSVDEGSMAATRSFGFSVNMDF